MGIVTNLGFISVFIFCMVVSLVLYFFLLKPAKKQKSEKELMLKGLKKGDLVVTIGGLHGKVDEINSSSDIVILDCEGIFLDFDTNAIARVTGHQL